LKSTGKPVLFAFEMMGEFRRSIRNPQKSSNPYRSPERRPLARGARSQRPATVVLLKVSSRCCGALRAFPGPDRVCPRPPR